MQTSFTALAGVIKRKDIAGFLAMGGPGKPIDNSIQRFIAAVGALDANCEVRTFQSRANGVPPLARHATETRGLGGESAAARPRAAWP